MDNQDKQQAKIQLLELLYFDSRQTEIEIANILRKSRQTISKMREDLWKKEIIKCPAILLNPYTINLQFFFMEIKTNPAEPKLLELLKNIQEIVSIDGILGDYALILKFEIRTKQKFAEILSIIDKNIAQSMFQSYRIIETIEVFKQGGVIIDRNTVLKQIDDRKWNILEYFQKNYNIKKWEERFNGEFFSEEKKKNYSKLKLIS